MGNKRVVLLVSLVFGCLEAPRPELGVSKQAAACDDCGDGGGGGSDPWCSDACRSTAACNQTCRRPDESVTTCGALRQCKTCTSACTTTGSCTTQCLQNGALSNCGTALNRCRKYDVYCAYPVFTEAGVRDINENGTGGALAYMYFGSSGGVGSANKRGSYASQIGGFVYDPNEAWASNFRGPACVDEDDFERPQWEWYDSAPGGKEVFWGTAGTPYAHGQVCQVVSPNAAPPTLNPVTDSVYEDDECFGPLCNPDDHVGSLTIFPNLCNDMVFNLGRTTGWTTNLQATVDGDIWRIVYKMWCYSCRNAWSPSCSTGVIP